ncbi:MAG: hypothetical protein LBH67_01580 [Rickettsia sp.]|nr:hypothetical protein [Rickettsia sp.]
MSNFPPIAIETMPITKINVVKLKAINIYTTKLSLENNFIIYNKIRKYSPI